MINILDIHIATQNPESEAELASLRTTYAEAGMPHQRVNAWLRACRAYVHPELQADHIDITNGVIPGMPLALSDVADVLALAGTALLGRRQTGDTESAIPAASMTAAPSTAPPSTRDAEQACVDAYGAFLAARRHWHDTERAHAQIIQAGRS